MGDRMLPPSRTHTFPNPAGGVRWGPGSGVERTISVSNRDSNFRGVSTVKIIIRPGDLRLPLSQSVAFGRDRNLVIEVGFGDGRYLSHLAAENPDWNILGVEVSLGSVWRAYRRMLRDSRTNVRLFRGDARFLVRDVIGPNTLSRIYVNFPDPWPRKKHRERRLLRAPFFELLSTRLCPEGALSFTTDHEEYFHFAIAEAASTELFRVDIAPPPEATLQTKYAQKWQEMKKEIFHAEFTRVSEAEPHPALITKTDMHHAILDGELTAIGSFEKQIRSFAGGHVIILEAFRDLSCESLIFKVRTEEPDLVQEILIQAWQKPDGVFVSLQPFGDPLATRGVREAVHGVTDWLATQGLSVREKWI
jgi:tRNA (guanine-N7-)-methyltransferase